MWIKADNAGVRKSTPRRRNYIFDMQSVKTGHDMPDDYFENQRAGARSIAVASSSTERSRSAEVGD